MREGGYYEGMVTSPRGSTTSRPRSVREGYREVYHPAVQDLSEQATRNGAVYQEESILSVAPLCTPRQSRPSTEHHGDKFSSPNPLLQQLNADEIIKSSPTTQMCFNHHNNEYLEDLHRQRVLVSAHQRRKLHRIRRSHSTPLTHSRNSSATDVHYQHRNSWQASEDDADKLELVVTNSTQLEKKFKERINYRLTLRTKPKSLHGNLMANGSPLPLLNGYSQTLLQSYPKYSQKYSNWLTNGFKVQSFRGNQPKIEYNHSRPPPPLVQYLNRPKTHSGRWGAKRGKGVVDFNIVGLPKEVQNPENGLQQTQKTSQKDVTSSVTFKQDLISNNGIHVE